MSDRDCTRLPDLTLEECRVLLDTLVGLELADNLPITTLIGLAADKGSAWADLRVGELTTLLGLAAGDTDVALEGCVWIRQLGELDEQRSRVYRCIENLLQLETSERFDPSLSLLFGADTLQLAYALINREQRFLGLNTLGPNMEGSAMHTQLLRACQKVQQPQMA